MSLLRSDTYIKGIFFSTIFNLIAKIIAFGNSIVVAFYFGTQTKTDIYFYAIATIALLVGFVNSLNHSVLIPESIRIREQQDGKKAQQFLTYFLYLYVCIGIATIIILYINPVRIFSVLSKFDEKSLSDNIELIYWIIPLCVLILITTYLTDILAAYKYFIMPMVASSINSILSLLFVVLFHDKLGLRSIVLGLSLGYLLNIAILLFLMKSRLHWIFEYKRAKLSRLVINNIFYAQAGNITSLIASYLPLYLLSGFSNGIITALNYGKNVSEIPNQMITSQISVVSGIRFNELVARKEFETLNATFLNTTKFLIFILVPISGLFFVFSEDIIKLLFMRGAFNTKSVEDTALFLKYFGILVPFLAINTMIARIFMATQRIKFSFLYQIGTNIVQLLLIYFLVRNLGIIGYPVALILVYGLSVIAIYPLLKYVLPDLQYIKVIYHCIIVLAVNIVLSLLIFSLKSKLQLHYMIEIIAGSCLYLGILIVLNELFHINNQCKVKKLLNLKSMF